MQLVWVITVSRFFDRVLFLPFLLFLSPSFGSLFGPACAMHNNRRDRRGRRRRRRRGWRWRACVYGAIFARNLEPFQASARDLYTRETCVCAWIEFNIPWIQDFARGRRAIFMMFQRRLGEIYARLSVWIKIRGIVILSRNPFTSTTRCTYKFAQK